MNRFTVTDLSMAGLMLVERQTIVDNRGFLSRMFCSEELAATGWLKPVAHINHTYTAKRGTVRGMHFQSPPNAEMKLISCLRGKVWDVAVDLRASSDTFLQWHAEELSADNQRAMLIPEGFAHGFQALTDNVEMLYCHSAPYHAESERGLNPRDPFLTIAWPFDMTELSDKDARHPLLTHDFHGLVV
jgi:dTDP-4-dehydrorhamnose 3,5-epimerase